MKPAAQRRRLRWCATCATLAFVSACSSTPDKITLLPDPDGTVGSVIVRSGNKTQVIDKAYATAEVAKGGAIEQTATTPANVEASYGDVLAAQPPRPKTYTINFLFYSATELAPQSNATVQQLKAALAT